MTSADKSDKPSMTDEEVIAEARGTYAGDDVQIDASPSVARAEDGSGAWCAAWVWVPISAEEVRKEKGTIFAYELFCGKVEANGDRTWLVRAQRGESMYLVSHGVSSRVRYLDGDELASVTVTVSAGVDPGEITVLAIIAGDGSVSGMLCSDDDIRRAREQGTIVVDVDADSGDCTQLDKLIFS